MPDATTPAQWIQIQNAILCRQQGREFGGHDCKMKNDPEKSFRASAVANEKFICVETYSGYRSSQLDLLGAQHLLNLNVGDGELGAAVRDALLRSRFVTPREAPDLFDPGQIGQRYAAWIEKLTSAYGYKNKNDLFRNMMSCSLQLKADVITIRPSSHEKLDGWSGDGIGKDDYVTLEATSAEAAIGSALRLAFSRCR